jgi:hypothetical protein
VSLPRLDFAFERNTPSLIACSWQSTTISVWTWGRSLSASEGALVFRPGRNRAPAEQGKGSRDRRQGDPASTPGGTEGSRALNCQFSRVGSGA